MKNFKIIQMESVAQELNDITFTDYFNRLMLLAKSVFKWNGLPDGISEKEIERYLFSEGRCMFYEDEEFGFIVAKCSTIGKNYKDEPTKLKPILTGISRKAIENNTKGILIRNNDEMIPTSPTIQLYALRLTNLTRTIDINVDAQKTPTLVKCTDKQKTSLKHAYKQWEGNEPVIFADSIAELDKFNVLKTDAPIVFDKLQLQKHAIWNEVMSFLGINNANQDKKERLVADEVGANDEQIELSVDVMLKARQEACKLINEKFNTNISVEVRKLKIEDYAIQNGTKEPEGSESEGKGDE